VLPGHLYSRLKQAKELRNTVSHEAGLAVTPEKVDDLFQLLSDLYRRSATNARLLMTSEPMCIADGAALADACALMLDKNYSQLPVLRDGQEIIGLLTEKDILRFQAHSAGPWDQVMVGEVLPPEAAQQLVTVVPQTTVDCVRSHLVKPEIPAVLVTPDGTRYHLPLGIITRADLLRLV
jgi:predicted transcriptional regulator